MTLYDGIVLTFILIGIIIIIVSFLFSKYDHFIEQEEDKKITQKMDEKINYDEVRYKILELNEYGEYLKEELEKKHKELLFLYQMILEKQKEMQIDSLQKQVGDISKINRPTDVEEDDKQKSKTEHKIGMVNNQQTKTGTNEKSNKDKMNYNKEILDLSLAGYSSNEIAKKLKIGIGQVDLVLNLFR